MNNTLFAELFDLLDAEQQDEIIATIKSLLSEQLSEPDVPETDD